MSFDTVFDSIKENATLAGDIVRVKLDLRRSTNQLAHLFRRLGSTVYEAHLSGEDKTALTDEILEAIDEKRAQMDILYAELNALNGKVECEACHSVVAFDCDYCPKCGARLFYEFDENGAPTDTVTDAQTAQE